MMSHLIGIDWGTSAFRAYLYDIRQRVLCDKRVSDQGMSKLAKADVGAYLHSEIDVWLNRIGNNTPIIGSGMIGSDLGLEWIDYVSCPTSSAEIFKFARRSKNEKLNLWLVPGLSFTQAENEIDTMRGEETQLLGLDLDIAAQDQLICMPGTHSKWVHVNKGKVESFRSAITGELYSCLQNSTLVKEVQTWDFPTFELGVHKGLVGGTLLSSLFGVRSLSNFKTISPNHTQSYLSGLLIATEISEMLAFFSAVKNSSPIYIVGAEFLSIAYENVFRHLKIPTIVVSDEKASTSGFFKLYEQLSLAS